MKTIERKIPISKTLVEVWEWKDEAYNAVKDMRFEEKQEYYMAKKITPPSPLF